MPKKSPVLGWAILLTGFLVLDDESKADASMAAGAGIECAEWLLTEGNGSPVLPRAGERQPSILLDPAQKKAGFEIMVQ